MWNDGNHLWEGTSCCTLTIMYQNCRMIAIMFSTVVVSCQGMWLQFLDYLHKRKEKEIRVSFPKKKKKKVKKLVRLYLWNAQHTPPPFWCLPSPQMAKQISFPLSPFTSPSLVEFSHLLFLHFLLHLRFFFHVFQIWILSWTQNSAVYANQPSRLGAAEMCRTSDTLWNSRLWCCGLSYIIWKVILQLLPEAAPLGQDFRQEKNL